MEQAPSANEGQFYPPALLYVPPLRIVAPPGVHAVLPPTFNLQNPFDAFMSLNGVPPHFLRERMGDLEQQQYHQKAVPQRPISSAIRDYPLGCGRPSYSTASAEISSCKVEIGLASSQSHAGASTESPSSSSRKPKRASSGLSISRPSKRPPPVAPCPSISPAKAVLKACRIYHAIWRNLILDEEFKGKESAKGSRPDLNAGSVLNTKGLSVNRTSKVVGHVPGVGVGDMFFFRMEICCIGMHGPVQGGIEYITSKESQYNVPVAISIISAGGYDAQDDGDELVYTGQGGKSGQDNKQTEDQKLERGNLAMEGSMKHQVPVRVTRGIKDPTSPSGKTYTYDGLYKVDECWSERGKLGFEEFKFRLRRLPGQVELGSALIKLSNQLKYKPNMRQGMRVGDLSNGKEAVPLYVLNTVDSDESPPPFHYSTSVQFATKLLQQFGKPQGCDCKGSCALSQGCLCFSRNENTFAYINNGMLVKERGVIYECGSSCTCSLNCRNRVTQRASKYRFEVFKTENRGWGLRSRDIIAAGSFVCEYIGRFVEDVHVLPTRDYVLNLGMVPESNPRWGDVSSYMETQTSHLANNIPRPSLIIDSSEFGNLSRFINHSCSPNLLAQCVLQDQLDTRCPHVMLFAKDNIMPFRELTIDYGVEVASSELEAQGKPCLCESEDCRKTFGY